MGLNAFFCVHDNPWPKSACKTGPGNSLLGRRVVLIISATPIRETIAKAIPRRYESGPQQYRDIFDVTGLRKAALSLTKRQTLTKVTLD